MQTLEASGGLDDKRGNWFEVQSLLNYFLTRLAEGRRIAAVLESVQDATFTYTDEAGTTLTELIQCKKCEDRKRGSREMEELLAWDGWPAGNVTFSDLKGYLASPAGDVPLLNRLESPDTRYTLLLFGKCNPEVKDFVPSPFDDSGSRYDLTAIAKHFPPGLEHKPKAKRKALGSRAAALRVRVLPMPSPTTLGAISQRIVVEQFNVSGSRAFDTVQRLEKLFQVSSASLPESRRHIDSDQVLQLLQEQAGGIGRWHSSLLPAADRPDWLSSDDTAEQDEPLWAEGNAAEALLMLKRDRALVVCGPLASGKTSICRFVTREFRRLQPTVPAYYLEVRPRMMLEPELQFFLRSLQTPSLFIIDDEQYAEDEVRRFVKAFVAQSSQSWLLVTSSHTFAATQAFRSPHPLNQVSSLKLEDHTPAELTAFLKFLQRSGHALSEDQIRSISSAHQLTGGKLGFARLLADVACKVPGQASPETLTHLQVSQARVAEWTRQSLELNEAEYTNHLVPILLISPNRFAFLPAYKPQYLEKLRQIGVMSVRADGRYEPQDPTLPLIVWQQHRHQTLAAVAGYLREFPSELPGLLVCFAMNDIGKRLVASILRDQALRVAETARMLCREDLHQVAAVLRAARAASRDEARALLRDLVMPMGQWSFPTIADILSCRGTMPVHALTQLLEVMHHLDRQLAREMFRLAFGLQGKPSSLLWTFIETLMHSASRPDVELSDLFELVRALRRCHETLAANFLEKLLVSPAYKTKQEQLGDADPSLARAVRCCQELRFIDHALYQEFIHKFLGSAQLTLALTLTRNPLARMGLLRDVRRISPRTAVNVLRQLWTDSPQWLEAAASEAGDIVSLVGVVRALAAVDQRIATAFALQHQQRLCLLVDDETDQFQLASAIATIHKVSAVAGRELGKHVRALDLVQRIHSENDRMNLVGKTLSTYADLRLPVLREVMVAIDARGLLSRIVQRQFLPAFVFLAAGLFDMVRFASAKPADAVSELVTTILGLPEVVNRLRSAMETAALQTQVVDTRAVAFAFFALRRCGLTEAAIFKLFDIQNPQDLLQRIDVWIAAAADVMSAKELIYGMVLLGDYDYASRAVCGTLKLLHERKAPRGTSDPRRSASMARRAVNDLAELGDLFRIAAVVDDSLAVEVVESIDKPSVGSACREEWNLGRRALLLQGLRAASWANFRALVEEVYAHESRERIVDMVEGTENLNHLTHLVRELRLASHPIAASFFSAAVEGSRDRILALLGAETNLISASQWMRTAHSIVAPHESMELDLRVSKLLLEIQPYDERLFSNVEAALALTECGFQDEAKLFTEHARRAGSQIGAAQNAIDLVDVLLRAKTIDRRLGETGCAQALLEAIPVGMLQRICGKDQPMVVTAYALFGLRRWFDSGPSGLRSDIREVARALRERVATEVRWPFQRAIATILMADSAQEANEQLAKCPEDLIRRLRPWETGLLRLLFSVVSGSADDAAAFGEGGRWHATAMTCSEEDLQRRRFGFSDHASSIKLALALRSAPDVALCAADAAEGAKFAARRVTDNHDPITSLLLQSAGAVALVDSPLYFKLLLSETVLNPFELDWASRTTADLSDYFFARRD